MAAWSRGIVDYDPPWIRVPTVALEAAATEEAVRRWARPTLGEPVNVQASPAIPVSDRAM
jgi:hypothetical protein